MCLATARGVPSGASYRTTDEYRTYERNDETALLTCVRERGFWVATKSKAGALEWRTGVAFERDWLSLRLETYRVGPGKTGDS